MKKLLTVLTLWLSLASIFSSPTFAASDSSCTDPFVDLIGHWAADSVCQLYSSGVVNGYSEKTFSPNSPITRAEFVKILVESLGYNVYAVQSAAFTDTATDTWYYAVLSFAHSKGFASGYSDGSFHPNNPISRAEVVELLVKASGQTSADTSNLNHQFTDVSAQDWFATSLAIALRSNIIQGYGDGSFRPNNSISRAEACVMMVKALDTILQ